MRRADFIAANCEPMLTEWVAFARTFEPARTMDLDALRDHAKAMLDDIVIDLRTSQTDAEQAAKSKGPANEPAEGADTAAEIHGAGRAVDGFSIAEMVSEYRALRANVVRLWTRDSGSLTGDDFEDLRRFNEAIDQALAESIVRFSQDIDESRQMFGAVLGHDVRTPIVAITTSSQFMLEDGVLTETQRTLTGSILRSARRMNRLVGDLLALTRIRFGTGIPIVREQTDLGDVARDAIDEVAGAHPGATLRLETSGDVRGHRDAAPLSQMLTNLLDNAVQHGTPNAAITVTTFGEATTAGLRVHNHGTPIAEQRGTTFTVRLPR